LVQVDKMARLILALALLGVAQAFVPAAPLARAAPRAAVRKAASMEIDGLLGAIPPFGYFDPLQMSKGKTLEQVNQWRECEIKHGRIAMAAWLGYFVQPNFHPLAASCHISNTADPIASGIELPGVGKLQILLFVGFIEFLSYKMKGGDMYKPGDLLGAAYFVPEDEPGWVDYQQKELSNGRLAMVGFAGAVTQKLIYGDSTDFLFKAGLWKYLGPQVGFDA